MKLQNTSLFTTGIAFTSCVFCYILLDLVDLRKYQSASAFNNSVTDSDTVLKKLGTPFETRLGERIDEYGARESGFEVWCYCTRFCWLGCGFGKNSSPQLTRIVRTVDPRRSAETDMVVEIWMKHGIVKSVVFKDDRL
jgi:hypothetical protein